MWKYLKNFVDGFYYQTINSEYIISTRILFNVWKVWVVLLIGILIGYGPGLMIVKENYKASVEAIYLLVDPDRFEEAKLRPYLEQLNIRFIDVAIAQSMEETGHYGSAIFKESHNLFGMKLAVVRPTTAIGELRGHALYRNWRDSCIDYALFQARYAGKIVTEDQYIDFLGKVYATNPEYKNNLRKHLKKIRS